MALGSFLKKLAGPAAGVATSLIPGVGPALAGPAAAAVGGLVNKGGKGGNQTNVPLPPPDAEEAARRKQISGDLQGLQTTATGTSGRLLTGAEGDIGGARGFYSQLASGDPAAAGAAFAPQLNQARLLHQRAIEDIGQNVGRGGGRAAALGRERIDRAGTMSGILAQAPMIGAQGLQSLAQTGGQLGLGSGQLGLGAGSTAADIGLRGEGLGLQRGQLGLGQQQIDLQRRGQNIDIAKGIGTGVADILGSTGLTGKIGRGLGKVFGAGGDSPPRAPTSIFQPLAGSQTPPAPTALPQNIPAPPVVPGPVTNQYNAAYDSALKLKKPLNQLAR